MAVGRVVDLVVVVDAQCDGVVQVGGSAVCPRVEVVGSAWGAVSGLLRVRFPRPPSEPDVRLSPHPALHEVMPMG